MTIRVLLADDQPLVRVGLRMLVDSQADLRVVGEADDGRQAVELIETLEVDVVLMDVRMPHLDGVAATRELMTTGFAGRVIVLTTFDLDEYVFAAVRAGAAAFLLKDTEPEALLSAIRTVHAGDSVVSPSITRRLLEHFVSSAAAPAPTAAPRLARLTGREREVLALVARGLSNAEIAATLVVAETTVKTHVSRLLTKTDSRDRVHLVVLAYEAGVTPR